MPNQGKSSGKTWSHGATGYGYGCRCDVCRAYNRERTAARRKRKSPPTHGTESAYRNHGCRCAQCKPLGAEANAREAASRKEREPAEHGASGYLGFGCRCPVCVSAAGERSRQRRAARLASVGAAPRKNYPWTGPELELAARDDLTGADVARMIGRSVDAVYQARKRLRSDPKTILHAGIGRTEEPPA